ncbi:hypothetical protein [Salinisphaera hydrothermalis]|uniref:hypothetical protein n=1 Tax=Salinisphaera hydrothermalis TaxID=563188 RepID=UPI00333E603F
MPTKSQQRVARYYARQNPQRPAWGYQYQPAIRAVREEAPARSRPTIISAENRLGRTLHLLSRAEVGPMLLALYAPFVFDVHEQRVLDPAPTPHPLHGHPTRGVGQLYRSLPGTWAVAAELGYEKFHPRFPFTDSVGRRRQAPHPLVGDILLFVTSEDGCSAYCVNWNIKATPADFTRRLNDFTERKPILSEQRAVARHAIERAYYAAAGIATHEIAADSLPPTLVATLRETFAAACRPPLPAAVGHAIVERLRHIVGSQITPAQLLTQCSAEYGVNHEAFRDTLLTAVWHRELRLDLFDRIYFDRPLRPEKIDVLEQYAQWFAAGDAA